MRVTALLVVLFAMCFFAGRVTAVENVGIIAVIGNRVISNMDIMEHASALKLIYGVKKLDGNVWRDLASQAVNDLTDIVILENKATEIGYVVSDNELNANVANIQKSLKMDDGQFIDYLNSEHVSLRSLKLALKVRALWSRLLQSEIETKINTISSREVAELAETIKHNMAVLESVYTTRHINMKDLSDQEFNNVRTFVKHVSSCRDVDVIASNYGIRDISGEFEIMFKDFSPEVQLSLASRDEYTNGVLIGNQRALQVIIVCGVSIGGDGGDSSSYTSQARNMIAQHRRIQITNGAMERLRGTRFVEVRSLPSYNEYLMHYGKHGGL